MATRIVTKSGSGAPTTDDLIAGELAVDLTNGRLYTEDLGGTVLELGLNPSGNVDVTGTVTATGTSVFASLDISGDIDVDGTTNLDVVDIDGAVDMASTLAVATRVGIGVAAHASAALNITTTDQHIRLSNGSELGVIELDSDGELNIWAHGDGETINLKTGSGAGTDVLSVVGSDVGIGTSSPSYNAKLDVNGIIIANVGSGGLSLSGNAAPDMSYVSYNYTNSNGTEVVPQLIRPSHRMSMGNGAQDAITFDYRAANAAAGTWQERMRIDASGRVGIGTSLPTGKLSILGGSLPTADSGYSLSLSSALSATRLTTDASSGTSFIGSYYDSTSLEISQGVSAGYTTGIVLGARNATNATVSDAIAFYTRSTERLRIDSSGNVGIGVSPSSKLDINISTNARGYFADNIGEVTSGTFCLQVTNSANAALKPLGFRAEDIRFATGSAIRMTIDASGHAIIPAGVTLGTAAGVYAAANTLDDYEEGTWTPSTTVGLTSTYARYTKVGNRVFFDLEVTITTNSNAGQMQINGLPFALSGEGSATLGYTTATVSNPILMVQGTSVYFYSGGTPPVAYSTYSNKLIRLTGTYMTTA
jgi:hypothetical protein